MGGRVRTVFIDDRAVVQVTGDLDVYAARLLRAEIHHPVDSDQLNVLVILTQTTFIDSSGLGALMEGLKAVRDLAGRLDLVIDDTNVLEVLRIAGMTRMFVIHSDLFGAIEATN